MQPIRLHVDAKRYLCAIDGQYFEDLSTASKRSMKVQGGVMSQDEAEVFKSLPFAQEAIQLREWDDEAKVPDKKTEPTNYWLELIKNL